MTVTGVRMTATHDVVTPDTATHDAMTHDTATHDAMTHDLDRRREIAHVGTLSTPTAPRSSRE